MAKKLEKLGLKPRVDELLKSGITTGAEIHRILVDENPGVKVPSESAVQRYVSEMKELLAPEAQAVLKAHVDKTITADLEQLEALKQLAFEWAADEGMTQAERISSFAVRIRGEIDAWRDALLKRDEDGGFVNEDAVKFVIKRAIELLRQDDRRQDERLKAIKEVMRAIGLKCSNAGLLGDNAGARIIFEQRHSDLPEEPGENNRNDRRFMVLSGRKDDAS